MSSKSWAELDADERAAAGVLGFTEMLWSTAARSQTNMNSRKWLNSLKMSELMSVARDSGVRPEQLDDALDEDSPKSVIISLMSKQAAAGFMQEWQSLSEAQVTAADVLGLGPECFSRLEPGQVPIASATTAHGELGPADDDELVLLEPAVFNEGERPNCPKCGALADPVRGGPVHRAKFACCNVEATPYEVTVAEARRLFTAGDFDEAESMFDESAMLGLDEQVPEDERATCYLYRGLALVELDEIDEAMECFASSCEIVALGTRRDKGGAAEPAPALESFSEGVNAASTSAVASYIHGLLLRSEGRDESKAKALIDAAIQMAASSAIEDIASNVEEVTRSVGTKDYGKKHTYEQAYSRALQLRCFWDYCGAASLAAALMSYDQYSYAADACTTALGQMHIAKEGVMLEIELGMPQLLSHREEQRRHRVTVACHRARAQCMFQMQAWTQALDDFKETARRVSSDPTVMYHIGLCQLKLGQWRESKESLNKAKMLDKRAPVLAAADTEANLRLVNQELKKQEQAANKAERELLASLEAETSKSKKPSKKQKKRQREAERAKLESKSATCISAYFRGHQARQLAARSRLARDEAHEKARKDAIQRARDEKREKARIKAELSAEAVQIEQAVALAKLRVKSGDDLDDYMCPLTLSMFVDPVSDVLGHTYERKAIDHWLNHHTTSPKTNEELSSKHLRPNKVMLAAVETIRAISRSKSGTDVPSAQVARPAPPPVDYVSDEVDKECPLCCEQFDETDLVFKACPCDYKVCLYCFHHIKDRGDGKCPACRADYGDGEMGSRPEPDKSKQSNSRKSTGAAARKPASQPSAAAQETLPSLADLDMMADEKTYRTKICKRWQDGHCSYGASCWFAHGKDQLRSLNPSPGSRGHDTGAQRPAVQQAVQHATNAVAAAAKAQHQAKEESVACETTQPVWGTQHKAAPTPEVSAKVTRAKPFPFDIEVACEYCVNFRIEAVEDASRPINKPNKDGSCGGKYANQKFHKGKPWKKCVLVRPKGVSKSPWIRTRPRPPNYNGKLCFNEAGNTWSAKKNSQSRMKLQPVLGCANDKQCRFAHGGFEKRVWETPCPFGSRKRCEYGDLCPMNHDGAVVICPPCDTPEPSNIQKPEQSQLVGSITSGSSVAPQNSWQTHSEPDSLAGIHVPSNDLVHDVGRFGAFGGSALGHGTPVGGAQMGGFGQNHVDQSWGAIGSIGGSIGDSIAAPAGGSIADANAIGGYIDHGARAIGGAIGVQSEIQSYNDMSSGLDQGGGAGGFFSGGFFGADSGQDWMLESHQQNQPKDQVDIDLDAAAQGWGASMLSSSRREFSSRPFAAFTQPEPALEQLGSASGSTESVDYDYAVSRAVRRAKIGIILRFDGLGRFFRVPRGDVNESEPPAGVWSIQRRHGHGGSITVLLTLTWLERVPDSLLSDDGGLSFMCQAEDSDDGPSLSLRSTEVPHWFLPSSPQRRPSSIADGDHGTGTGLSARGNVGNTSQLPTSHDHESRIAAQSVPPEQPVPADASQLLQSDAKSKSEFERGDPPPTLGAPVKGDPAAHRGQQWHAYLGWVDAKLTPKQLQREEKKKKKEDAKMRKKDGVTQLTGFQPVFAKDLNRLRDEAEERISDMKEEDSDSTSQEESSESPHSNADFSSAADPIGNNGGETTSAMRRFLTGIKLASQYCSMLEEQEFVDVELFSQCTDTDFADLGMAADHVQRIREALPVFLAESAAPSPPAAEAKGSIFTPDPRVRKLLELANVDVEKYFNLFCAAEIDSEAMQLMSASDMKDIGVSALGPRRKILHAISINPYK